MTKTVSRRKASQQAKFEVRVSELGDKKIISIAEAAELHDVSRQAIYVAIKHNKIRAIKQSNRWMIHVKDLLAYRELKYSRTRSMFQGELLFDNKKGYYSINQVANMLELEPQKLYYATRSGYLKASRKGAAWVIHIDAVREYEKAHLGRRSGKRQLIQAAS